MKLRSASPLMVRSFIAYYRGMLDVMSNENVARGFDPERVRQVYIEVVTELLDAMEFMLEETQGR